MPRHLSIRFLAGMFFPAGMKMHMSHSLNSLKGGYIGDYIGDYYRGY